MPIDQKSTLGTRLNKNIKIAAIDDHKIFLGGLTMLVEGMKGHYSVTPYDEPVALLKELESKAEIDLIICDLIMNAMNGLAFISAIRSHRKTLPILMLSGINAAPPIAEVKRLGANGFVHKSVADDILQDAIQTVLEGGVYFDDGMEKSVVNDVQWSALKDEELSYKTKSDVAVPKLGPRQKEVLHLMAEGATNKEISRALEISENTVKTYMKQLFTALDANKRTSCVKKAQALGLL